MIVYSPDWGPKMPPTAGPEEGVYSSTSFSPFLFWVENKIHYLKIVGALLGMPARVEGSAMTLIPNSSTTDVADEREFHSLHYRPFKICETHLQPLEMNGPAQATLEPLKEHFEEEEDQSNSEDEGLNMKEIQKIQMEVNIESSCKK